MPAFFYGRQAPASLLGFALRVGSVPAVAVGAALLLAPAPARAHSAADKATARSLATTGIKLYRAGNYKGALDKLRRAEALYDAPIHLLYIARCQVKLGKVVEGAETYRRLGRVTLQAGAPEVFVRAKATGAQELAALEPEIPALRVEVQPPDVNKMDVVIDGEHLPAAVVGIDRAADPGKHTVRVSAPGFEPVETTVELRLSQKLPVKLKLEPSAGSGTAAVVGAASASRSEAQKKPAPAKKKPALIGFMAGLRLGGAFFVGNAFKLPYNGASSTVDMSGAGVGMEFHGGIRIAKYFTPVLFFQGGGRNPPDWQGLKSTTASYQGGGLGLMVGTPRNRLGVFGELDLTVDSVSQKSVKPIVGPDCTVDMTASGVGGRLGGGAVIPVASFLQLTPFVMVTLEKFTDRTITPSGICKPVLLSAVDTVKGAGSIGPDQRTLHAMVFLGVGGDFVFGADKPLR